MDGLSLTSAWTQSPIFGSRSASGRWVFNIKLQFTIIDAEVYIVSTHLLCMSVLDNVGIRITLLTLITNLTSCGHTVVTV